MELSWISLWIIETSKEILYVNYEIIHQHLQPPPPDTVTSSPS